jgi:hypothetical protein
MPVVTKDITHVTISEDILLPTPAYNGFTINMTFAVRTNNENTVCEERHAILHFSPDFGSHERDTHVKIENGTAAGHSLSSLYWKNRYFSLPSEASSRQYALRKCQLILNKNVLWSEAENLSDYLANIRRVGKLLSAVEKLPSSAITFPQ